MSQPIRFKARSRDFREEMRVRLEHAPADHAEAILLPVMRYCKDSTTGASSNCCEVSLAGAIVFLKLRSRQQKTPAAIRGIRNLLIMLKLAGSIDPDRLHAALDVGHKKAPSLWEIGKQARTDDARRDMETAVALLGIFGAALNKEQGAKE